MHSSMKVSYYDTEIAIDCGEDWLGRVGSWRVDAIFVTHAHPDHAGGLREGAPCPVYATEESWETMQGFDLEARHVVVAHEPVEVAGICFEAFPVGLQTRKACL